jgi:hypothetical protein
MWYPRGEGVSGGDVRRGSARAIARVFSWLCVVSSVLCTVCCVVSCAGACCLARCVVIRFVCVLFGWCACACQCARVSDGGAVRLLPQPRRRCTHPDWREAGRPALNVVEGGGGGLAPLAGRGADSERTAGYQYWRRSLLAEGATDVEPCLARSRVCTVARLRLRLARTHQHLQSTGRAREIRRESDPRQEF